MDKKLDTLVKMQNVDDIIGEKLDLVKILPKELSNLKKALKDSNNELADVKDKLKQNKNKQKQKELTIQANKDKMNKYKEQLLTINTNKEYKALNSEVSHLEKKNSQIDDSLIELMEEEADLQEKLKLNEEKQQKASDDLKANENKLNKKIDKVKQEIKELRLKRNSLADNLNTSIVKRYAALIKSKARKAVVHNLNGACSGCGYQLRPQLVIEISEADKIIFCENCGRILIKRHNED